MSLRRFIARRLVAIFPILFGVSVVTFGLANMAPGDAVDLLISFNPQLDAGDIAQVKARYGLDQPVWIRYVDWLSDALRGDFGVVITSNRPVSGVIVQRLPNTIALGLFGWAIALLIAIPTGIYAAVNKDQLGDDLSRFVALSGISLPNFWLGLMLILITAVWLDLFSVLPPNKPLWHPASLKYLLLPGVTIGTASASTLMRIMRSSMAEEMNKEYVTAARAKGLPERTVILKHVLRNSLISVTTVAAFLTASILAGAVVVEQVFRWPGLGQALVNAVIARELDLIMAITLFTGLAIVIANLLADIMYAVLDPRIRY